MLVGDKNLLSEFCTKFCSIVEKHCKYCVVSGFFVIISGRSRGTEDVDIILERMDIKLFKQLHSSLKNKGFNCLQSDDANEIYEYLNNNLSVRYIFGKTLLPEMEVKFAKDKLDEYQLKTRIKEPHTELNIYFSTIECNLAFKEELLKSPKDIKDAEFLRIVYEEKINEKEVEKIKEMIRRYRL